MRLKNIATIIMLLDVCWPVQAGSAVELIPGAVAQARPQPVRPATRPTVRPTNPRRVQQARQTTGTRTNTTALERDTSASELVERIEAAAANSKKRARLSKKLREIYGLDFVEIGTRFTLVRHREIVGVNLGDENRALLEKLGFRVLRRAGLPSAGVVTDLLAIPDTMTLTEAYGAITAADTSGVYYYNSVYAPSSQLDDLLVKNTKVKNSQLDTLNSAADELSNTSGVAPKKPKPISVGMIDTGVNAAHKMLGNIEVTQHNWGRGVESMPRSHGTAVASILASNLPSDQSSGVAGHHIIVADVFSGPAVYADAEAITIALDWLARQNVGVINISLTGPPSDLLQHAVARLIRRGHILVAAVGNQGAEGPPMYPASYLGVVGVTAVDAKYRVYKNAYQGDTVDFSAYGVKVKAASLSGRKKYSGTSFAAPVVAGYLAGYHIVPESAVARAALEKLLSSVNDVGPVGYDPIFGFGLLSIP